MKKDISSAMGTALAFNGAADAAVMTPAPNTTAMEVRPISRNAQGKSAFEIAIAHDENLLKIKKEGHVI